MVLLPNENLLSMTESVSVQSAGVHVHICDRVVNNAWCTSSFFNFF